MTPLTWLKPRAWSLKQIWPQHPALGRQWAARELGNPTALKADPTRSCYNLDLTQSERKPLTSLPRNKILFLNGKNVSKIYLKVPSQFCMAWKYSLHLESKQYYLPFHISHRLEGLCSFGIRLVQTPHCTKRPAHFQSIPSSLPPKENSVRYSRASGKEWWVSSQKLLPVKSSQSRTTYRMDRGNSPWEL